MPIQVTCACGKQCEFGDELAGWLAKCPACGRPVAVPRTGAGAGPGAQFPVAPRPRRKRRTALFMILGAAGLVVVVAGLLVVVFYLPGGPPSSAASKPPAAAAAAEQSSAASTTPLKDPYGGAPRELSLDLGNGVMMKLVLIPAGKFMMGSPENEPNRSANEGPQHEVTISSPFYMGVYEVTVAQCTQLMGSNFGISSDANEPTNGFDWERAVAFCQRLSQRTGRSVRLPTEAEWEYACRAGSKTRFSFGDDETHLNQYAFYHTDPDSDKNAPSMPIPVGQKKPNAWGLYDMHGNVSEMCSDWYADSYAAAGSIDPKGSASGKARVARGGRGYHNAWHCRSASREEATHPKKGFFVIGMGVRVVVDVETPRRQGQGVPAI